MHQLMGILGLLGAVVVGLLAISQMETLIDSMNANATGGLNTLIGGFNFLIVLIVILAGAALVGMIVKALSK